MPIPALLAAAPGLIKAGASLFGGGKRRRAEQQAQKQLQQKQGELENFEFQNPYANLENTAEDQTINQQATNVQAQQTDQALAQGLDAITAGGGGGGDAQAIAAAALQAKQGASADIAGQEQRIQSETAAQASANQLQQAQGAGALQQQQFGQVQQGFNLAQQNLSQAQAARQQAKSDLVGGLADSAGAVVGGIADGSIENPFARLKDNPLKRLYSPLKNNGDEPVDYKKLRGSAFEQDRVQRLYGAERGSTRGSQHLRKAFDDNYTKYKEQFPDASKADFKKAAWRDNTNPDEITPWQEAYQTASQEAAAFADEDAKAFRAQQDADFAALDPNEKARRGQELFRNLENPDNHFAFDNNIKKILQKGRNNPGSVSDEEYGQVRDRLESFKDRSRQEVAGGYLSGLYNSPTNRMKTPLYRQFRMKYKGMYK